MHAAGLPAAGKCGSRRWDGSPAGDRTNRHPLAGWLAHAPGRRAGLAPSPSAEGPKGKRVAILGQSRHGPLARRVAANGGRVVSAVGSTTTILAVIADEPGAIPGELIPDQRRRSGAGTAIIDDIGSDLAGRGLAAPWIEHPHRRVVGMDLSGGEPGLADVADDRIEQR